MAASEVIQLDSESSEDEYEVRPGDKLLLGVCVEAEGCGASKERGFAEFSSRLGLKSLKREVLSFGVGSFVTEQRP